MRLAAQALRLAAQALRQGRQAEWLAPSMLRQPVMTTGRTARGVIRHAVVAEDGAPLVVHETHAAEPSSMLLGARVAIVDGRPVRAFTLNSDPIVHLLRESKAVTERQWRTTRPEQYHACVWFVPHHQNDPRPCGADG